MERLGEGLQVGRAGGFRSCFYAHLLRLYDFRGSSREGLLDAMRMRHSYGATDNIVLDYRLQAGDKEYLQGDIVTVSGPFQLAIRVIGTEPIRQIDIIKTQGFALTRQNLGREVSLEFTDTDPSAGENYYYVRVQQVDGQLVWSSPIWVTVHSL